MRRVLLSIKPQFADKIFRNEKKFEFRKVIWKEKVEKVIVYSTAPVMKIIGEFDVERIFYNSIITEKLKKDVYEYYKKTGGITEKEFLDYYKNSNVAEVIKIKNPILYENPKYLADFSIKKAPQNFCYIPEKL